MPGGQQQAQVGRVSGRSLSPSITHKPFVYRGEQEGPGLGTKRAGEPTEFKGLCWWEEMGGSV